MASNNIKDDIYYSYGYTFGSRIKVVIITANTQFSEKDRTEVKRITSSIHEHYISDRLNPLSFSSKIGVSDNFSSLIKQMCAK